MIKTLPSAEDIAIARESGRALSGVLSGRSAVQRVDFHGDNGAVHPVGIPTVALQLLLDVLTEIGHGNAVAIVPMNIALTTQEAADVLSVSRPFVVQLLERGEMAFHKIGTHRRVRYQDVIAYKRRLDTTPSAAPGGR